MTDDEGRFEMRGSRGRRLMVSVTGSPNYKLLPLEGSEHPTIAGSRVHVTSKST